MANDKNSSRVVDAPKPNLPKELFWDWRYADIDWKTTYRSIIERVLERGTKEEWRELVRFYSEPKIIKALQEEIRYLPNYIIDEVTRYFNLRKEDLACYARKQSRRGQWI